MTQDNDGDGPLGDRASTALFLKMLSPDGVKRGSPKNVGLADNFTPREMILAHGLEPLWIEPPAGGSTASADVHLEGRFPEHDRALLSQILDGHYKDLALLILGREHSKLYYYLTEFHRRGLGENFPPIHHFDLIPQHDASVAQYNALQITRLRDALERASGVTADASDFREAIRCGNRVRDRLRRIQALRWQGRVPGSEGFAALALSHWMSEEVYVAWVDGTLLRDQQASGLASAAELAPRVVIAPHASLRSVNLHDLAEGAGLSVVGENDWIGSQGATPDMSEDGDPIGAILRHSWRERFSHDTLPREARHAWLKREAIDQNVDGVIFHIPPDDQMFGWDYPDLRNWLENAGKKTLLLDMDIGEDAGRKAAVEALRNWKQSFEPVGAGGVA